MASLTEHVEDPLKPREGAVLLIFGKYVYSLKSIGSTSEVVDRIRKGENLDTILAEFPVVISKANIFTTERVMEERQVFDQIVRATERVFEEKYLSAQRVYQVLEEGMNFVSEHGAELGRRDIKFMQSDGKFYSYKETGEFVLKDHDTNRYYKLPSAKVGVSIEHLAEKYEISYPKVIEPLPYPLHVVESDGTFHMCGAHITDYKKSNIIKKITYYINTGMTILMSGFYGGGSSFGILNEEYKISKKKIGDLPITNLHVERRR